MSGPIETCIATLDALRRDRPRVHAITNAVAMSFSANILLAAGAHPSMTHDPREVAAFTRRARALSINIGTLDDTRREAIPLAIDAATEAGIPWVLDPVMASASEPRMETARALARRSPTAIRGNAAEIEAMALDAAVTQHAVVAATGAVDRISQGTRQVAIHNGHPLMDRVTAMGCAETALIAAFLAGPGDPFDAVAAAILAFNIAGEIAGDRAAGPGTFEPCLLDALYTLTESDIRTRAKLS